MDTAALRIDPERFQSDFETLARIGATPEGGVHRPALGEAHLEARAWYRDRAAQDGLEVRVDGAGNHSAVLRSGPPRARTLLLGSHLDSVPNGGCFDGAYGVLAALEVLRVVQAAGVRLAVHLEAVDFTDEEGTLVGLLGSQAVAGRLTAEALQWPRGGRAQLEAGLARAELTEAALLAARRDPDTLAGYLELHIEQGPFLHEAGLDIGIVSAIVGVHSYELTFVGEANHAGTTPMLRRKDASLAASAFVLEAQERVVRDFPEAVVNVGAMHLAPGVFNIVPGRAELALEFRAADTDRLAELHSTLMAVGQAQAERYQVAFNARHHGYLAPAPMDAHFQTALLAAAQELGFSTQRMPSGAFHDAQSLTLICPAGMIFVPSVRGVSHSPQEYTTWDDCVRGANVLLQAALRLGA
jgi:N-carbamoyl-L-amino-acid hydrolase